METGITEPGITEPVTCLRYWAATTPDRVAFAFLNSRIEEAEILNFGTLERRARALAAMLQDRAVPGDRALLAYPPGPDFVIALFACFFAGIVAVPAPGPRTANRDSQAMERLAGIAAACRPSLVLTTSELSKALASIDAGALCLATDSIPETLAAGWSQYAPDETALAFLQYTSGSTGTPKGVMISYGNLAANLRILDRTAQHDRDGCIVSWLPHYHDMGLIGTTIYPVVHGTTCRVLAPTAFLQRPIRWLQAISHYRASTSGGPNFAYDLCVRRTTPEERAELDLSCWTLAFNGAEPIRAATLERFADAFAPHGFRRTSFFPCYGLAESTLIATGGRRHQGPVQRMADNVALAAGVLRNAEGDAGTSLVGSGAPQPGHVIAIVDPDSRRALPPGRVGEIWIAGSSVTEGYWEDADNATNFAAELCGGSAERFLRTGDLGALWGGELYVTGRLKDLIIVDGRNHHAEDIESTLEEAHPAFRPGGCAAFGVEVDGSERLVVVTERDRQAAEAESVLLAVARAAVARRHELALHDLVFLRRGTLPRTTSGKVRRRSCRQQYLSRSFEMVTG